MIKTVSIKQGTHTAGKPTPQPDSGSLKLSISFRFLFLAFNIFWQLTINVEKICQLNDVTASDGNRFIFTLFFSILSSLYNR